MKFSDAEKGILAKLDINDMWRQIFEIKNLSNQPMFPNLETLVYAALSLSDSNAEAEILFSIVTDVKDKKRNRLDIQTLKVYMQIAIILSGKECRLSNL